MHQHRSLTSGSALIPILAILAGLAACDRQTTAPDSLGPEVSSTAGVSASSTGWALWGAQYPLYRIDDATGAATLVGPLGIATLGGLSTAKDGTLYGVELRSSGSERLVTIDRETGAGQIIGTLSYDIDRIGSIVFDANGTLYGVDWSSHIFEIDPATGDVSNVRTLSLASPLVEGTIQGMGFVGGTLYACCGREDAYGSPQLVEIDLGTATATKVGPLGLSGWAPHALAVRPSDGVLYGWSNFTSSRLATIDPSTGQATFVDPATSSSAVLSGLAFAPLPSSNAPPTADANGPYTGEEGSPIAFDGTGSSDPEGGTLSYAWAFGDGSTGSGATPSHTYADDGSYTAGLTVEDPEGATDTDAADVTIANVAPTVTSVSGPTDPVSVGATVSVTASFTDPGVLDTHTATMAWGDGSSASATVSEADGSGTATASHTYASAGVYTVTVTVEDDDGGIGNGVYEYVVVYDPDAGFVTGGGWIDSPAGAYVAQPDASGKASFGFVSRYRRGATTPTGNTQFQFRAGALSFHSSAYDWLVIAGSRSQYKGTGTVNGEPGYGFMLVAIDGDAPGGGGTDRFRIKIWELATEDVVYDNQLGEDPDSRAATVLGGGSIVIHGG